ncbi:MAG: hypothetical protein ACXVP0_09280 [Bacteroidia bacterium]
MKKIVLLLSVAVVCSLTSCKKDRVCECTSSSTAPGSTSTVTDVTLVKAKKSDAKRICVKETHDFTVLGTTYTDTQDCKLK